MPYPAESNGPITMDLFQDWDMIIAGLYQTYGQIDLSKIRARDLFDIYIPNMHKDTNIMQLVRIRQTPTSKLTKEERIMRFKHKLKNTGSMGSTNDFTSALRKAAKAGGKHGGTSRGC